MRIVCPPIASSFLISDNAQLAAQVSCAVAEQGHYLPIVDGPRLARPDREAEIARRNNAAARAKPSAVFLVGLSDDSIDALVGRFAGPLRSKFQRISTSDDVALLRAADRYKAPPLVWGRGQIGIGVLKALREGTNITFGDAPSPLKKLAPKGTHLVVCEEGNDIAQVIAANYAHSLRAGLCIIPSPDEERSDELLESFYSLYEDQQSSQRETLERLKAQLRDLCGPLTIPPNGTITFITGGLPYGFGFSETPSTHLFKYPDLGIAVVNGFAAEQPDTPGTAFVALVNPETTDALEIEAIEKLMPPRGAFVRTYFGPSADVRNVSELMEFFPYDLLVIATHCGDTKGYRWTYEFRDSEGYNRRLVVDMAIGVARTDDPEMLKVTQFMRFVSLDGVDWNDPQKTEKLYVGRAIVDFLARIRDTADELKPVKKDTVPRVIRSAALKMHDQILIVVPKPLADARTPIIINNACASWHRLAKDLMFSNARAYIGTLFPITASEAHEVVSRLFDRHFGKPIPDALWSAQRELYGEGIRRPYVVTGVYPQRLRIRGRDVIQRTLGHLTKSLSTSILELEKVDPSDTKRKEMMNEVIAFYEREVSHFREVAAR